MAELTEQQAALINKINMMHHEITDFMTSIPYSAIPFDALWLNQAKWALDNCITSLKTAILNGGTACG